MATICCISLALLFINTMCAQSGLVIPMRGSIVNLSNDGKRSGKDLVESGEIGSLLDRQIPDDIIYDLAGQMKLITRDEITDEYLVFTVNKDKNGIPFVKDPETGHQYLVKHSRIRKGVDIYRITFDQEGRPVVTDWATMTVNRIRLNKYKEVELEPIVGADIKFKFGRLNLKL